MANVPQQDDFFGNLSFWKLANYPIIIFSVDLGNCQVKKTSRIL
jgi:hypothetical protein